MGKDYIKAVYCHPDYLNYMQSTSYEILGWMKHKLDRSRFPELYAESIIQNPGLDEAQARSRLPGEVSIISDIQMAPPLWQKAKKN